MTTVLPGAATLALSRCDLLERRVAELERQASETERLLAEASRRLEELRWWCGDRSTFLCAACWTWSAPHSSCRCGKNDSQGMHRGGADGPSAGDPPLQCPDATRGAPLTAEQGTSATISPPVGHGAQGEPATGQSSPHETADGGLSVQPGDRCVVYTGGDPVAKAGTVESREHDGRWLVALDRAGKIRVNEFDMVLIPDHWRL